MCAQKAVIVFRHGDKDDKANGVLGSDPSTLKNLPSNNYYSKTLIAPGTSDKPISIYYSALMASGYTEGESFGVTIPTLVGGEELAPITHAFILNPSPDKANGNSYITSYPVLIELVKDPSFSYSFYSNPTDITGKLNLDDFDGSVLVVGTAEVLSEAGASQKCEDEYNSPKGNCKDCDECKKDCDDECNGKDSILFNLNAQFKGDASKPHRGLDIYAYIQNVGLKKFIQDPNTQTYKPN